MPSVRPTCRMRSASARYTSYLQNSPRPWRACGRNLKFKKVMLSGVSPSLSISSPLFCCAVTHWRTVGHCFGLNWFITREFFLNGVSRFLLSKRLRDATVNTFLGISHSHPEEKLEFRIHYADRNAFWVYRAKQEAIPLPFFRFLSLYSFFTLEYQKITLRRSDKTHYDYYNYNWDFANHTLSLILSLKNFIIILI